MGGWRLGFVKFSFVQRIRKVIFFIKNPNLTKKILAGGRGGGGVWLSDFFKTNQV